MADPKEIPSPAATPSTWEVGSAHPPTLDFFSEAHLRQLFAAQGYTPQLGSRTAHVLLQGAERDVYVMSPPDALEPDLLLPAEGLSNPLVGVHYDDPASGMVMSWLYRTSILEALDGWLASGNYPPPSKPVLPGLGRKMLGRLAHVINVVHPGRPPYPLLTAEAEQQPEVPKVPLVETVEVEGVGRWLITPRTIRSHAESTGALAVHAKLAAAVLGRFAANLVTKAGGTFPPRPQPQPGTFIGAGVVYLGESEPGRRGDTQPQCGVEPGAFLEQYDAFSAGTPLAAHKYGERTRALVGGYAAALQALVMPPA
ncbi:MAG TPA: hypothetical protein VLF71_06185 [Candidatus Saccharimonadales bacterium]|nr:hypothetical protein [Candidatus Saccharimonadales bacterium]